VLSALYPATDHPYRLSRYIHREQSLKVEGLNFPVQTKQIPLFEKRNPSISINVLAFEESSKGFTVEYRSPEREREHHVNLLLLENADNPSKQQYLSIKNMPALVLSQNQFTTCNICLQLVLLLLFSQRVLDDHMPYCYQHEPQQVIYPNPHNEKE